MENIISKSLLNNNSKGSSFFEGEEFLQFMTLRINKALAENDEYKKLQHLSGEIYKANDIKTFNEITDDIETIVVDICYMQGWKDAVKMLMGSL